MNHSLTKHRRLYSLLRDKKLMARRHDLVYSHSNGRTENSAELTDQEIDTLLEHVAHYGKEKPTRSGIDYQGQQMRRRILSMCYNLGWVSWCNTRNKTVVDMQRLDAWMKKYGYLHKPMNSYSYKELPRLVTQFEKMLKKELDESKIPSTQNH